MQRMTRRFFALVTLQLVACATAPRHGAPSRPEASVRSVALTVADLESATRFFADTLGFTRVEGPVALSGPEFAQLTGIPGARAHSEKLELGREQIELVAFEHAGREIPDDSHSDDLWFQHVALVASELDSVRERVRASGAEAISEAPQTLPLSNPAAGGIRAFYFRGPSRHPLELISYPPGKGQARWHTHAAPLLGIDHTAIAVADTERARAFYEDVIGLHAVGKSFNYGSEQEALSGVPGARVRITGLRGPAGPGVEFLQYEAPPGGRPMPADTRANDLWHCEITLAVRDLDRTVERLRAARAHFVSDRAGAGAIARMSPAGGREVAVLDPDGHALKLVE
jgi:catechol 2,3-dioxygenase-like lactoylglutathione lyase family enzyme